MLNYMIRRRPHMREDYVRKAIGRIHELQPDCVVCTGDVTCVGSLPEFAKAKDLLHPLVNTQDFDFIYVPGNHDAYVRDSRCRRALTEAFEHLNRGRWSLDELPVRHRIQDVEFLLVNECMPTPIWGSYGALTAKAREALLDWYDEPRASSKARILIGHFPTRRKNGAKLARRRELRGGDVIREGLVSGNLNLSLCGHIHDPYINAFESDALEVCTGSLTTHGRMDIVDIDAAGGVSQSWESVAGAQKEA